MVVAVVVVVVLDAVLGDADGVVEVALDDDRGLMAAVAAACFFLCAWHLMQT